MLKQIGKYTISERIGRGTHSRVYRAIDTQGRSVAIKVSTTQTEPEHLDEFQKDLVQAASVLHPSLVAVHDLGFEDDFPYLVMELVEGHDLDKLLKSNSAPSVAERIRAMQEVGGALQAAHERGVFHLDIRPSKIMLGASGEAKLLGLGLGRLSFDPARVTEHGYLVGAPFYMSPERLTAIDTANERCDIWSFGVTFYEWMSGRHPFYDDDGDRMIGNIMDAVPADLVQVPAQLNHSILRAIEKDPNDRYHSFAELLADLQPLMSDLKREESDALMAEALKQTDSGRWHEARRIARQMRDLDTKQGPSSQIFGISEQELEKEKFAERPRPAPVAPATVQPLVAAAAVAAAASMAAASTALETPEPAPIFSPEPPPSTPVFTEPARTAPPSTVAPSNGPQRPERTAPKIPSIGVRNGTPAAAAENNGSPAGARVQPQPASAPTNGARAAAAAAGVVSSPPARPAVVRDLDPASRSESIRSESVRPEPVRSEAARTRPTSTPQRTAPARSQAPQQSVRILDIDEPSGLPWARILGFTIPGLLMVGALLFFLLPGTKRPNASSSSEEAKEVTRAGRVIKTGKAASSAPPTEGQPPTEITPPPTAATPSAQADGIPANGTDSAATQDPANPAVPKAFDPKSLAPAKAPAPPKRRGNAPLNGVAPPPLTTGSDGSDAVGLPVVAMNTPPPPAPVVPPAPTPTPVPAAVVPAKSTAPVTSAVQSVEAARAAASHVGGVFEQPTLVHTVQPIYPPAAVQRKAQGTVRFQATIAKDGSVKNIQLLSGDPLLNVAARQAVLQWKYRPAMLNGDPIEVTQAIVVNFNLSNR